MTGKVMKDLIGIKLFIFDLDETIASLKINWEEVRKKIRKILKTNQSLIPLIPSIEQFAIDSTVKKRIYQTIDNEEMKMVKKLKSDKTVVKLFKRLKELDYNLALVTLQGRIPAIEALRRLRIYEYFDLVVSRDEKKDREDQIREVLETMNVKPFQAIVVADKLKDMQVAKKIGCKSIAISDKLEIDADFKLSNIKEISNILGGN